VKKAQSGPVASVAGGGAAARATASTSSVAIRGGACVTAVQLGWRKAQGRPIKFAFVVPMALYNGGWKTAQSVGTADLETLEKRRDKGEGGCRRHDGRPRRITASARGSRPVRR